MNSNAGVRGSFKGGKKYEITGDNILATLLNGDNLDGNCGCKTNNGLGSINGNGNDPNNGNNGNCGNDPNQPNNDKNRVEVCGKVCEVDKKNSVAAAAVCKLPQLNTKFSTDQWKKFNVPSNIIPKGHAYGASKQDQLAKWYDGDLTEDIVDNSNPPCFFEVEYPPGQVGKMHKTKFFVKDLKDKTPFVNNLKFRGSNDGGATWDDLWVVDNNICEGWNYKEWENDDERPKYNKYRWEGTEKGKSCRITEVEGDGVVIIDDDSNEYSCNVELIVEG